MDGVLRLALVSPVQMAVMQLTGFVDVERAFSVATFMRVVHNHDGGRDVAALSYSAHPSAQETLERVAREFTARDGVHSIAVAHRTGDLAIGDVALFVAVSAVHRYQAFPVLEELVNRVKAAVPIWKHQEYTDGTRDWPGSTGVAC